MKIGDDFFCFVGTKDGDDGILATELVMSNGVKMFVTLVGSTMKKLEEMKPLAELVSQKTGLQYKILKFKCIDEIPKESICPNSSIALNVKDN